MFVVGRMGFHKFSFPIFLIVFSYFAQVKLIVLHTLLLEYFEFKTEISKKLQID